MFVPAGSIKGNTKPGSSQILLQQGRELIIKGSVPFELTKLSLESVVTAETVCELLDERARHTPGEPAYFRRAERGEWAGTDWRSFWQLSQQIASNLYRVGVAAEHRVALFLPNTPEWQAVSQGVQRCGGVVVGLDYHASPEDVIAGLKMSAASFWITDDAGLQRVGSVNGVPAFLTCRIGDGAKVHVSGARYLVQTTDQDAAPPLPAGLRPTPEQLATIVFTSGTTGDPKGIAYRHGQIMAAVRSLASAYEELGQGDHTICWLPLSAMFQRMANLLSMACGIATYFVDDPRLILQEVAGVRPTFFIGVPRFYEKLEAALSTSQAAELADSFQSIKLMISGSSPLRVSVLDSLEGHGLPVREAYGLSENTVPVAVNRLSEYRFGSVGKPLPPNEVRLAEDGEILVRGPGVFEGYLGDDASQGLFTEDGFYRTGDLGRFDEDGFLFLIGRKKDLIKTSTGRRIAPSKIEAVYSRCPSIEQVLVVGDGRNYLVALVTLSSHHRTRLSEAADAADFSAELLDEWLQAGESLSSGERIEAFGVLPRPFGGDEVTVSQKLRRAVIVERWATLIDRIYAQPTPCVVIASDEELALADRNQEGSGT